MCLLIIFFCWRHKYQFDFSPLLTVIWIIIYLLTYLLPPSTKTNASGEIHSEQERDLVSVVGMYSKIKIQSFRHQII